MAETLYLRLYAAWIVESLPPLCSTAPPVCLDVFSLGFALEAMSVIGWWLNYPLAFFLYPFLLNLV